MHGEIVEIQGAHVQLDDWSSNSTGRRVVTPSLDDLQQGSELDSRHNIRKDIHSTYRIHYC